MVNRCFNLPQHNLKSIVFIRGRFLCGCLPKWNYRIETLPKMCPKSRPKKVQIGSFSSGEWIAKLRDEKRPISRNDLPISRSRIYCKLQYIVAWGARIYCKLQYILDLENRSFFKDRPSIGIFFMGIRFLRFPQNANAYSTVGFRRAF